SIFYNATTANESFPLSLHDALPIFQHVLASDRSVNAMPAWTPDGRSIVFASDRQGTMQLWSVDVPGAGRNVEPRRLSSASNGISSPEPSPDGQLLAAVRFRADGWHLGIGGLSAAGAADVEGASRPRPVLARASARLAPVSASDADSAAARPYSPWGQLLPRYWTPIVGQGPGGGLSIGALSSGSD